MEETPKPKCSICHLFWKLIFSVCLFVVGFKYLTDIDSNHGYISQNSRLIAEKFKIKEFNIIGKYSELSAFCQACLIMLVAIFELLGLKLAKILMFFGAIFDIVFIHNPYFYQEPNYISISMLNLGLFGAVLNN